MSHLGIIIVNYRTAALTLDCLASLAADGYAMREASVVVVDNASGDGSADALQAAIAERGWGARVTLMNEPGNRGFAAGNNTAIRRLLHGSAETPEYIMLLNPDTCIRPQAIHALVTFMRVHPRAAIAGSRLEDPDGTPQVSAFRFHNVLGEFEAGIQSRVVERILRRWRIGQPPRDQPHLTDWVAGASMIISTAALRQIGLLDERYFMYYEEVDFCSRARACGWECWYVPGARVVHLVGQSSGVTNRAQATQLLPDYWFQARLRYFRKNGGSAYAVLAELAYLAGLAVWRVRMRLLKRPAPIASNRFSGGVQKILWPAVLCHD